MQIEIKASKTVGFKPDLREYGTGAQILMDLGLSSLRLMTNNPRKIVGLDAYGLKVVQQVPIEVPANEVNAKYLQTKRDKMGHQLRMAGKPGTKPKKRGQHV